MTLGIGPAIPLFPEHSKFWRSTGTQLYRWSATGLLSRRHDRVDIFALIPVGYEGAKLFNRQRFGSASRIAIEISYDLGVGETNLGR
jgi:hypothetical protein